MALKITERKGKLVVEGNMNSTTRQFLKQHLDIIHNSTGIEKNYTNPKMGFLAGHRA